MTKAFCPVTLDAAFDRARPTHASAWDSGGSEAAPQINECGGWPVIRQRLVRLSTPSCRVPGIEPGTRRQPAENRRSQSAARLSNRQAARHSWVQLRGSPS